MTTESMYYANSIKGGNSNTFLDVTLTTIAGITCLFGLLFLVDPETFAKVTGAGTTLLEIPVRLQGDATAAIRSKRTTELELLLRTAGRRMEMIGLLARHRTSYVRGIRRLISRKRRWNT
jgi:hypothetical protein